MSLNLLSRLVLSLVGLTCICFPAHILGILPYLLGSVMAFAGGGMIWDAAQQIAIPETRIQQSNRLSRGIVLAILGIITIFQGHGAVFFIGISWGLLGIGKGSRSISIAICTWKSKRNAIKSLLKATIELTLGCMLLFHPAEKIQTHIVLLGLQIIFFATFRADNRTDCYGAKPTL